MMQKILLHKKLIIRLFQLLEVGIVVLFMGASVLVLQEQVTIRTVYELGRQLGIVSMLFYCLSLVPGILKRFQVLTQVQVVLMAFRRHYGIMMYVSALAHMSLTTTLGLIKTYGLPFPLLFEMFQYFGLAAVTVLFPLFLTSNDWSVKKLGKKWNTLHKLTYVALGLIFIHVAMVQSTWLIVIAPTLVLWALSWFTLWTRKKIKDAPLQNSYLQRDPEERGKKLKMEDLDNQKQENTTIASSTLLPDRNAENG